MKNIVILAPHIDDELIGCFSILKSNKVKQVIFFYDITETRLLEAKQVALKFDFSISTNGYNEIIHENDILYVPNINDYHPDHKAINYYAKTLSNKKVYYSIDMNKDFRVLTELEQYEKKLTLLECYSSQSTLFNSNDKYHLFEAFTNDDSFKTIWVTFQKVGIHYYPMALPGSSLDDVSYLSSPHRHLFKFKVWIEVFHDDREIEFHQFLNWLESLYNKGTLQLNNQSCEMIANNLYKQILLTYPKRYVKLDISEDGECGTTIEYSR